MPLADIEDALHSAVVVGLRIGTLHPGFLLRKANFLLMHRFVLFNQLLDYKFYDHGEKAQLDNRVFLQSLTGTLTPSDVEVLVEDAQHLTAKQRMQKNKALQRVRQELRNRGVADTCFS
jgi:hypothetical protein